MPKDCSLHDAARVAEQNVKNAIEVFHQLKAMGHTPFVPHLSHYIHINGKEDYSTWWYEYDLTFLDLWVEGVVMLKGWEKSHGSRLEYAAALNKNLPIFEIRDGKLRYLRSVPRG